MPLRLYVATTSQGKLRDFRTAAETHAVSIDPLPDLASIQPPEENGATFAANATIKAVYYSQFLPNQLVLADDSGLEVDALSGAPGVRSARFAADAGLVDSPDANDNTDVWNNMVLLQRLDAVPPPRRTARYRCVLVAARNGKPTNSADGAAEGMILECPARHWRLRLRPSLLPAAARPHHGRNRSPNQARHQSPRPRLRRAPGSTHV